MVNKVQLIGYLADAPAINTTQNGKKVAKMRIGTSENYKDAQGQKQTNTDWHNLVMFDKLAETASQWLKKGSFLFIEGKIKNNSYEKDGQKKYFTEIIVSGMTMLPQAKGNDNGNQGATASAPTPANSKGTSATNQGAAQSAPEFAGNMDTDNDLPF